jgi:hypothetical protein
MPIYDDLPTVVVAPLVDTVTPEPIADEDLDALPIPTVHEVVDDLQPEVEDQVATPQPKGEVAPPDPEPTPAAPEPESVPKPVPGPVPKPPSVAGSTGTPVAKNPVELPPPVDDEDVWEDADEPPPPSEPPPRAREPRASPEPTPPEHLPERRVVVIDEDAEPPASSRPSSRGAADDEPDSPTAVASIGATLEEEGPGKRRWRLFRKGGE